MKNIMLLLLLFYKYFLSPIITFLASNADIALLVQSIQEKQLSAMEHG